MDKVEEEEEEEEDSSIKLKVFFSLKLLFLF
jgi:hypothetical protein